MNTAHSPLKVYLVDDTQSVRQRLAEKLRGIAGVEIVGEAGTPSAATAGILAAHPHAVLLDLRLEGGSGMEVLKSVHPRYPDIVFIVLTNHAEPAYQARCVQLGASYFLDKTLHIDSVADIISGLSQRVH